MFRCKECQREYDIKPDFCDDCGNDIFEEINTEVINSEPEIKAKKYKEEITKEIIEEKPSKNVYKKQIDYPSFCFLLACILISIFILFFAWNDKLEVKEQAKTAESEVKTVNIPNIDSFWNNEPPKVQPKEVIQKPVENIVIKPETIKNSTETKILSDKAPKPIKSDTAKKEVKNTSKVQQKTQQKVQTTPQAKTPKTVQAQPIKPKIQTKPQVSTVQTVQKPIQTVQPSQNQTTPQVQQSQTQQNTPAAAQIDSSKLKAELNSYKTALRNAIGKKIDFAYVIGDGSCVVSFKVDSTGKLINRAFSQQSTNTTLNDAVYKAIMATPSYNPPPSGYKNETMYLKITFYNGNFQISLN